MFAHGPLGLSAVLRLGGQSRPAGDPRAAAGRGHCIPPPKTTSCLKLKVEDFQPLHEAPAQLNTAIDMHVQAYERLRAEREERRRETAEKACLPVRSHSLGMLALHICGTPRRRQLREKRSRRTLVLVQLGRRSWWKLAVGGDFLFGFSSHCLASRFLAGRRGLPNRQPQTLKLSAYTQKPIVQTPGRP